MYKNGGNFPTGIKPHRQQKRNLAKGVFSNGRGGVRTTKGCKNGEAKSLFIRQNTGKNRKSCPLYVGKS